MNRFSDDLDDMTLPQRPRRPDPRREGYEDIPGAPRSSEPAHLADAVRSAQDDREFTLSTGTVLVVFLGLALVCAMFFGFGYSMGRKSATAALADTGTTGPADATAAVVPESAANKPSAGSPAVQAIPGYQSQGDADAASRKAQSAMTRAATAASTPGTSSVTLPMDAAPAPKPKKPPVDPDGEIVEAPAATPRTAAGTVTAPSAGSAVASNATGGSIYVQIAAVSHKEDADVLLNALKRRGYSAFTRTSDGDRFIHVQVGPFPDKKDAEAMRQRLMGDGYNAMLK